jgi:gamma-glutamyltranspeptidase/glutathione hydrolase
MMNRSQHGTFAALLVVALLGCAGARTESTTPAPESAKRVVARAAAVTSASPWASEAGLAMLQRGGNAVDAAVATAFAVGVVEPQMSGLGGGGVALVWLQAEHRAEYLDFYSSQPLAPFIERLETPSLPGPDLREVAVPGEVSGLAALHERFGTLPWADVVAPAIRLAEEGFPVNQILAQMIQTDSAKLHSFSASAAHVWPDGRPLAPGSRLRNARLAAVLRAIAANGPRAFYEGEVAREVVSAMNRGGHPVHLQAFAGYQPQWKRPLCTDYRGRVVLSAPPPQTGAQVLHTLELLEPFNLAALDLPTRSARAFDVLTSALRVGMADNAGNDDPDWQTVRARGIASAAFARTRDKLIGAGNAPAKIEPASAASFDDQPPADACAPLEPWAGPEHTTPPARGVDHDAAGGETTHISVVDAAGNAVALTQTNSSVFGSGALAAGFFLNDSGYRFTPARLAATGRRPWRTRTSTIAPTIVLENGRVKMVVGAPGGGRIPTAIAQNMVYTLDYGLDPLEAVGMPRIFPSPDEARVQLENGFSASVLEDVLAMGYQPAALSFGYARLYMIVRTQNGWVAVADPRHDGEPRGY